ncbi:hypothetical protein MKX01_033027 [Papaver californicum]|nr:hypothetical protein MKX01_033027 [Papaver californicum]
MKPTLSLPVKELSQSFCKFHKNLGNKRNWGFRAIKTDEFDVIPVQSSDQQDGVVAIVEKEMEVEKMNQVDLLVNDGMLSFGGREMQGFSSSSVISFDGKGEEKQEEDFEKLIDRSINATIILAAGTFAITKLLTVDKDYWQGWTLFEILRYAPQHNWIAYEEALKTNPVLAKMMISGVVYSLGDWIAQCYEGKPIFKFDRARMLRSGIVGFSLHGSLSHYYYQFYSFSFAGLWVVPAKVVFDQTVWSAVWNSIYFTVLGLLRFESPTTIIGEPEFVIFTIFNKTKGSAGWKLWPFAHLITYGVVPLEQRLLWVDCIELVWVTILSTYSNEKSEGRSIFLRSNEMGKLCSTV